MFYEASVLHALQIDWKNLQNDFFSHKSEKCESIEVPLVKFIHSMSLIELGIILDDILTNFQEYKYLTYVSTYTNWYKNVKQFPKWVDIWCIRHRLIVDDSSIAKHEKFNYQSYFWKKKGMSSSFVLPLWDDYLGL